MWKRLLPLSITWIRGLPTRLLDALLPRRCALCGAPGGEGLDLCAACATEIPGNERCCARCALPLATPASTCGRCQRHPPPWERARVPFRYAFPIDRLETRFKFGGDLAAGALLSALWLRACTPLPERPAAVIPVPLSLARLRERGFNQALELARPIARALRMPLLPRLLRRTRHTVPQTGLGHKMRLRNVRGAFALASERPVPEHIALFDDVFTTGATLRECARLLRQGGARRIEVWAIARTEQAPR